MDPNAGTALAIIGAVIAAISAFTSWRTARTSARKDEVDALRGIIETQSGHVTGQDERIERLEAERDEYRARLTEIEAQYKDLCEWVRQLGYDPIARKPITQPLGGGL